MTLPPPSQTERLRLRKGLFPPVPRTKADDNTNPGSPLAIYQGCTCAVLDNHHGKGFRYPGKDGLERLCFWITSGCPLHAPTPENDPED